MKYDKLIADPRRTAQTDQADSRQVQNSEGGFVFTLEPLKQLERFLILGSSEGTFYASAQEVTMQSARIVTECLDINTEAALALIADVSDKGRAVSNDPAIVATALAIRHPNVTTHQVRKLVGKVIRTGTHLFSLAAMLKRTGGWGRKTRNALAHFYETRDADQLAYQAAKYKQREGWSQRDILRISHPILYKEGTRAVADWICGRPSELPPLLSEIETIKDITHMPEIANRVRKNTNLTWEMLPSDALASPEVWEAMISRGMPLGALVRNLGRLGALGILKPMGKTTRQVCKQLRNAEAIRRARLHPLSILKAQKVYAKGRGVRGSLSWTITPEIVEALEDAFMLAFDAIEPTGKRTFLGIDVSGSMSQPCAGADIISCAEGAAVMAMVTMRTEETAYAAGFSSSGGRSWGARSELVDLGINRRMSLQEVMRNTRSHTFGGTDCSLPMVHALSEGIEVDTFVVYTDNETYAGQIHPHQALQEYRRKMGIDAKLIVVGMAVNEFTIAEPTDAGMLDCVGFDTATPSVIADFSR